MNNTYELAVLYHPDLEIDLDKAAEKVNKIVTDNGGKITGEDNWGKRKLAYSIKNLDHAVYVFYKAEIPAQGVRKIESTLNITDEVIRFLITKPDEKAIAKAEAFKAKRKGRKDSEVESDSRKEKSE
jgi:small subunit ribosomal protein S6